jgi:hypothetical protein
MMAIPRRKPPSLAAIMAIRRAAPKTLMQGER